jgi:hypothetical protein
MRSTSRLASPRRRAAACAAAGGLAASALAALPASATVVEMADGHNITVFHNIDFVTTTGWTAGETVTVNVFRGGVLIGTATGAASDPEGEGAGLEVNHGPEAAPVAGDCWEGNTPDIRPGDRIQATNGAVTDTVRVDQIAFTGRPDLMRNGDVVVPFVAKRANGRPIARRRIDSAEFRAASNNQVRFEATDIAVQRRRGAGRGQYQMRYRAPFRPSRNDQDNPLNQRQLRRVLLRDGHAIGIGHVDPLPAEGMLVDGLTDTPGPAPGCEAAPSAQWNIRNARPASVDTDTGGNGLTVRGLAHDAQAVRVMITDRDRTTAATPTRRAALSREQGRQRWSVSFTPRQVRRMNGRLRVVATFTMADGTFSDRMRLPRRR